MGNLTAKQIESAKCKNSPYKLIDGDGLQLRVATDGQKSWLVRYMIQGKERQYTLPELYGVGPGKIGLQDARGRAAEIRALARSGIDYQRKLEDDREAERRAREQHENDAKTVRDLYVAWFPTVSVKRGKRGRKDSGAEIRRTFDLFVMPVIGDRVLTRLYATDVRPIFIRISDGGHNRQATALLTNLKQMFRWGDQNQPWKRLLVSSDVLAIKPEEIVADGYDPVRDNERDRVLTEDEICALVRLFPKADVAATVECAIWIMLSVGTRVGETVAAKWSEVDVQQRHWRIPAENTKSGEALDVALSDFTLAQFQRLWAMREALPSEDRSDFVFPSSRVRTAPLNNQTVGKAIADRQRRDGKPIKGRTENVGALVLSEEQPYKPWRCHDLRRTCGSVMQALHVPESTIHRCLNHARSDKLDRVYLQHSYHAEMADAWRRLGEHLYLLMDRTQKK